MKNKIIPLIPTIHLFMSNLAFAADDMSPPGLFFMTIKMFSVLAVVIGIILICLRLVKKYIPQGNMLFSDKKYMNIVETLYFGPKKSVVLLKVASEYILLGVSANEINYFKEVNIADLDKLRLDKGEDPDPNKQSTDIKMQSIFKKLHLIKK